MLFFQKLISQPCALFHPTGYIGNLMIFTVFYEILGVNLAAIKYKLYHEETKSNLSNSTNWTCSSLIFFTADYVDPFIQVLEVRSNQRLKNYIKQAVSHLDKFPHGTPSEDCDIKKFDNGIKLIICRRNFFFNSAIGYSGVHRVDTSDAVGVYASEKHHLRQPWQSDVQRCVPVWYNQVRIF